MEEKKQKPDVMKRIGPYAGSYKALITLGRILAAVSALVAVAPFYDLWRIIKVAVAGEHPEQIKVLGWQAVGITILGMLLYICALMCTHIAAFRVQANLRSRLMRHILSLPMGVFDREGTGKIRRIVTDSTAATESYIAHSLPDQAAAAMTPVGLAVLMLAFDWRLGLLCFVPAAIGFAFLMTMMGEKMKKAMQEYQNALDSMSNEAVEYVRGVPVVKTFGQTVYSFRRFKNAIDSYGKWTIAYTKSMRPAMTAFMTAINAVFAALIAGVYLLGHRGITPDLVSNAMYYILITPLLTVTLTKIAYSGEQEMTLLDAMKRVESLLAMEPQETSAGTAGAADSSIVLDDMSFRYPGAGRDALAELSLTIPAGSKAALVGPSGGGKSTAAQLIARFFDVTAGSVKIGGVDVRNIPQEKLAELVSFVFQDSRLLNASILENVRLAKPEATEEEVLDALRKARCMDIIEKLPQGIHTVLGSKGTYLSGGERQRLTIARAILKDAPILILDEATAFADPENEAKVQEAFTAMSGDKTILMIAHRLSTVTDADEIFVLEGGRLREHGTHEALLRQDGLYKEMYEEFNRSIQWKVGA